MTCGRCGAGKFSPRRPYRAGAVGKGRSSKGGEDSTGDTGRERYFVSRGVVACCAEMFWQPWQVGGVHLQRDGVTCAEQAVDLAA